jgi:hypothetical protein
MRVTLPKGVRLPQELHPLADGQHIVYQATTDSSGISEVVLFDEYLRPAE